MQFIFPRVFGSKLMKKRNFDKFSSKFLSNTYQPKANQEEIAGKLKGFYKYLILTRKTFKISIT
jgi:tRNA U34 2-thiouridine synthase MnmA/TrmU